MIIDKIEKITSDRGDYGLEGAGTCGVQISKSGHLVVVAPRVRLPNAIRPSFNDRKEVAGFSQSSASRLRRYLRETLADYRVLVTLTYPEGHGRDGRQCKRDLKVFFQRLRRFIERGCNNQLYGAFWFLEFQSVGAVHFHIFCTDFIPKQWLSRTWYEIVGSDDERHLYAGTRVEEIKSGKKGISAYACKYAAKQQQKVVPEAFGWVGRFWGAVGYRATVSADTFVEPMDYQSLAVKRAINRMEKKVYELKSKGKLTVEHMEGGAIVIYCRSLVAELELQWHIDAIESAVRLYNPRRSMAWFYFDTDIDAGPEYA